jgi:membrane protease subunit HflK
MKDAMKVNILIGVLIVGGIAIQNLFYTVEPEEQAVITRFDTVIGLTGPGLHLKLPLGIDRVDKVTTGRILQQEFGFRSAPGASDEDRDAGERAAQKPEEERQMLTGDLDMIEVSWTVHYAIRDPIKYLQEVQDPVRTLRGVSESVMRRLVGNRPSGDVFTTARAEICGQARTAIQEAMDRYGAGIDVRTVELQGVSPPERVRPAFAEVNVARQERERVTSEAMKQRNEAIPAARGEAKRTIAEAEAYAIERVNRAQGEVGQFEALVAEYRRAPAVTRKRLYLEAMAEIAPRAGKIIVVEGGPVAPQAFYHLNEQSGTKGGLP